MSEPCAQCDNQPCVFDEFRENFIETRAWSCLKDALLNDAHDRESTDVHRNLRRRLYREFISMNGIATNRRIKLPNCVEKGIRSLYPSKVYMGFKRSYDDVDNVAVDMNGEKVKGKKWIRTDEGSYEVEIGDSKKEEDSKEETSDDINVEH